MADCQAPATVFAPSTRSPLSLPYEQVLRFSAMCLEEC